jgi:hypothetical protein
LRFGVFWVGQGFDYLEGVHGRIYDVTGSHSSSIASHYDVNGDGRVTPLDLLMIVNRLNAVSNSEGESNVGGASRPQCDVNGDQLVSPLDALILLNYLNRQGSPTLSSTVLPSEDVDSVLTEERDGPVEPAAIGIVWTELDVELFLGLEEREEKIPIAVDELLASDLLDELVKLR